MRRRAQPLRLAMDATLPHEVGRRRLVRHHRQPWPTPRVVEEGEGRAHMPERREDRGMEAAAEERANGLRVRD